MHKIPEKEEGVREPEQVHKEGRRIWRQDPSERGREMWEQKISSKKEREKGIDVLERKINTEVKGEGVGERKCLAYLLHSLLLVLFLQVFSRQPGFNLWEISPIGNTLLYKASPPQIQNRSQTHPTPAQVTLNGQLGHFLVVQFNMCNIFCGWFQGRNHWNASQVAAFAENKTTTKWVWCYQRVGSM